MTSKSQRTPIKTLKTGFQILETLRELQTAGVTEIANAVDLPDSTVHDHLKTLEEEGYVVNNHGQYRIGARFLTLGGHAREQLDIYEVAKEEMKHLAEDTGEHVNLMIEEHGKGIFLDIATGDNALHLDTYVGMRVFLHTTALGKALLAHFPPEKYEAVLNEHGLPKLTEQTISNRQELEQELEQIRERGYALDRGERVEGVWCVAAPIISSDGTVLGALSVSGPQSRMQEKISENEVPQSVKRATNVIEVNATHI